MDIVERLFKQKTTYVLVHEAAEEITRLRAKVEELEGADYETLVKSWLNCEGDIGAYIGDLDDIQSVCIDGHVDIADLVRILKEKPDWCFDTGKTKPAPQTEEG